MDNSCTCMAIYSLALLQLLTYFAEVVVVDNVAGSDLLYCNSDPH